MAEPSPEVVDNPELHLAVVRATVSGDKLPELFDRGFPLVFAALGRAGIAPVSAPLGVMHGEPTNEFDISVAVPVADPFAGDGEVRAETIPAGRAARLLVRGDYEGLGEAYGRLYGWIAAQGFVPTGLAWEEYLTEPEPGGDPAQNETMIWVQVAEARAA
ncbi:MAG: AraC family transcriptional regulator [Candidatus Leucobacter sulfamidivorax]|nr:AraC family transcriptional regulator [Candidatus Leucobacter sulfamidivorax]